MKIKYLFLALFVILLLSTPMSLAEDLVGLSGNPALEKEKSVYVSMDFENAALRDILKAFSRQTGINFVASDIIEGKAITVYLNNVSVGEALSSILKANGLYYEKQRENVYLIKPAGISPIKTVTRIFKLNYLQVYNMMSGEEEEALTETTQATQAFTGQVSTTSALSEQTATTTQSPSESGTPKSIVEIIKSLMSPFGRIVANKRTNSLIITDIPESFEAIEKTIQVLDIPPVQVMIQAEIIETTKDGIRRIGIEYGTEASTAGLTFGEIQAAQENIAAIGRRLQWPIGFPFNEWFIKEFLDNTYEGHTEGVANSQLFSYGTMTADNMSVIIKLFARDEDTKLLSRPRVMTLSNEPAIIKITENTSVGVESTTISQTGDVLTKAERVETGIVLKVVPQVNDDGDIFMYLEPSIARVATSTFFSTQFLDPQMRSASSTVMVKNGDTVIIAGLIKTDNYKTVRKVPILGDIPVMGELFKSRYKKLEDTEILIFVTPHIVKKRDDQYVIPDEAVERERMMDEMLEKYDKKYTKRRQNKEAI